MRIALCQRFARPGDVEANRAAMAKALPEVDADLLVFPEVFLSGYVIRDRLLELAETVPGPSTDALRDAARSSGKGIVFGMAKRDSASSGSLANAAVFVPPAGDVGVYEKRKPAHFGPFEERFYFHEGRGAPVFTHGGVRFGVIVCYDLFFPELAKAYAMAGADVVLCIAASPSTTRPYFEKVLPARAIEDTVYVALCNNVGTQGNLVFWGGSSAHGPRGNLLAKAKAYEEETVAFEVDTEAIRIARENRPTLRDSAPLE